MEKKSVFFGNSWDNLICKKQQQQQQQQQQQRI